MTWHESHGPREGRRPPAEAPTRPFSPEAYLLDEDEVLVRYATRREGLTSEEVIEHRADHPMGERLRSAGRVLPARRRDGPGVQMAVLGTRDALRRNNVTVSGAADGRAMMFAHGFGCSQATWDLVAPHFEADHKVILFDHVGAGGSDTSAYDPGKYDSLHGYAEDVLEILDTLDVTDVGVRRSLRQRDDRRPGRQPRPVPFRRAGARRSVAAVCQRRLVSRRVRARRHRVAAGLPRQQLPGLVPHDGARHHGEPAAARAGRSAHRELLRASTRTSRGTSPT